MDFHWEDGFTLHVAIEDGAAVIRANAQGLVSLANHLLALSRESAGSHFHLDPHNALEDGSAELIAEKTE